LSYGSKNFVPRRIGVTFALLFFTGTGYLKIVRLRASLVLICLIGLTQLSRATLIAYEPFDYPAGELLLGKTNGFGFTNAWSPAGFNARVPEGFELRPGRLQFANLATRGTTRVAAEGVHKEYSEIYGLGRRVVTNFGISGTTFYLSYLCRVDAEGEYTSVIIGNGDGRELSIGKSGTANDYVIAQRGGIGRIGAGIGQCVGKTVFIVVKMEFRDGMDRFTMFVNPKPGSPQPPKGIAKEDLDLEPTNMIILYSRGAWSVDELRLGTTWADVTPKG
jgi:hypothetical protein